METIHYSEAIRQMREATQPFSVTACIYSRSRQTGGVILTISSTVEIKKVLIANHHGQIVAEKSYDDMQISQFVDVSDLRSGAYSVRIISLTSSITIPLIKL